MPLLALLAAAQDIGAYVEAAHVRTTGITRCTFDSGGTDVTVCGLRRADRYRVPFVTHDAGDRRYESVHDERARLIHRTTPMDDRGPFLVGGGMAGASMTVGSSGNTTVETLRPLAP